ncbi:MAG: transketolase [candidate division Zixibacteria bacterium RBG_16_53_22]|nr:MAG: transketolase [candidate division Zixibacteria bacterium RBG_16_53_22]
MPRLFYPVDKLKEKALFIRRDIITMLIQAQSGHSGGPLSCADFCAALAFYEANYDPMNPAWPERDIWFFSIGHVTPVHYSMLAEAGFFPLRDLMNFRQFGGHCQGHPSKLDTPGVEVSSGSLGQGLSVAVGAALGSRMDRHQRRIYCIMGDGEQQEGSIWEAAMAAAHYKLDNLCAIVDFNKAQIDGFVENVMGIEPLADKYRAFNWYVVEIDGHDMDSIVEAFERARALKGRPTVILAHTIMGKGVSFMEDKPEWHGKPPSPEQGRQALQELGTTWEEWSARLDNG